MSHLDFSGENASEAQEFDDVVGRNLHSSLAGNRNYQSLVVPPSLKYFDKANSMKWLNLKSQK